MDFPLDGPEDPAGKMDAVRDGSAKCADLARRGARRLCGGDAARANSARAVITNTRDRARLGIA
ncbi:MAG TPA: hypothetical protein VIE37_04870 [Methylomirabilota bacterium]